jgi:phosphotransacetylase
MLASLVAAGLPLERSASFSLLYPETLNRLLMIGDVAIPRESTPDSLAIVVQRGSESLQRLGIEIPRIALLAAVETVNVGLPATVLADQTAARFQGETAFHVQGPLSMDLAVSEHAALKKGVKSEVAGHADLLVAPSMTVARGVQDALVELCEEPAATAMVGGAVPIAIPETWEGPGGVLLSTLFASLLVASRD